MTIPASGGFIVPSLTQLNPAWKDWLDVVTVFAMPQCRLVKVLQSAAAGPVIQITWSCPPPGRAGPTGRHAQERLDVCAHLDEFAALTLTGDRVPAGSS
jgi:hypothetical protein